MRWIIGLVVSALAVMSVGLVENLSPLVEAQGAEQAQAAQSQEASEATAETRFVYSGGALEGVRKVAENAPRFTPSTLFVNLVGAYDNVARPGRRHRPPECRVLGRVPADQRGTEPHQPGLGRASRAVEPCARGGGISDVHAAVRYGLTHGVLLRQRPRHAPRQLRGPCEWRSSSARPTPCRSSSRSPTMRP